MKGGERCAEDMSMPCMRCQARQQPPSSPSLLHTLLACFPPPYPSHLGSQAGIGAVQPRLGDLDIPVGKLAPHKLVQEPARLSKVIPGVWGRKNSAHKRLMCSSIQCPHSSTQSSQPQTDLSRAAVMAAAVSSRASSTQRSARPSSAREAGSAKFTSASAAHSLSDTW